MDKQTFWGWGGLKGWGLGRSVPSLENSVVQVSERGFHRRRSTQGQMKLGTVVFADPRAGHGRKRCGSGTPWAHGRVREGKPKDIEREW